MHGDCVPQLTSKLFSANLDNLYRVLSFVKQAAKEANLEENEVWRLELAADEVFVNIVKHGYQDKPGEVEVTCETYEAEFRIIFRDKGLHYNPLTNSSSFQPENVRTSKSDGGFGIYFVLKMMDRVEYERVNEHNVLTLVKKK